MGDSGFVHLDFLNCCKFAEGDSRILMQKMARDRFRLALKQQKANITPPASQAGHESNTMPPPNGRMLPTRNRALLSRPSRPASVVQAEEIQLCMELGTALGAAKGDKRLEAQIWDDNWKTVYSLAEVTMARTFREF